MINCETRRQYDDELTPKSISPWIFAPRIFNRSLFLFICAFIAYRELWRRNAAAAMHPLKVKITRCESHEQPPFCLLNDENRCNESIIGKRGPARSDLSRLFASFEIQTLRLTSHILGNWWNPFKPHCSYIGWFNRTWSAIRQQRFLVNQTWSFRARSPNGLQSSLSAVSAIWKSLRTRMITQTDGNVKGI